VVSAARAKETGRHRPLFWHRQIQPPVVMTSRVPRPETKQPSTFPGDVSQMLTNSGSPRLCWIVPAWRRSTK